MNDKAQQTELAIIEKLLSISGSNDTEFLARKLLREFGSYVRLLESSYKELSRIDILTRKQIIFIKLVYAATLQITFSRIRNRSVMKHSKHLGQYVVATLTRERIRQCRVLFLNKRKWIIKDELHSSGTVGHVNVYPREVVRRALELNAAAVIFVQNQPDGDWLPSTADIRVSSTLQIATRILGIDLLDYIIVASGRWTSLRDLGLL